MTPCHYANVQNSARNISLLDKNKRALSDLELNHCLLVVKTRLKPDFNQGLNIVLALYHVYYFSWVSEQAVNCNYRY